MIISKILWLIYTSFKGINQIITINPIFYISNFKSSFFYKPIKHFFFFLMWHTTSFSIKIIFSSFVRFNYLFFMLFYCSDLLFFLIFNCFCLFFKSFSKRRISRFSLYYWFYFLFFNFFLFFFFWIRRPNFFTVNISVTSLLILHCYFSVNIALQFFISNLIINSRDLLYIHFKRFFQILKDYLMVKLYH